MKMKNIYIAILLAGLAFAGSSNVVPQTGKHEPDFTLTISTEDETVKAQKGMEISVSVEERNISRHTVNAGRPRDPGMWYSMRVLLDGHPASITRHRNRR